MLRAILASRFLIAMSISVAGFADSPAEHSADQNNKKSIEQLLKQATQLVKDKQSDKAVERYEQVLEQVPDNGVALQGIARIHYRQKEFELAIEFFRQAIAIDPSPGNHNDIGLAYGNVGRLDLGLEHLRTANAIDPENKRYINNLATLLMDDGQPEAAFSILLAANKPDVAYYNFAYLLRKHGDIQQCRDHLDIALEFNPKLRHAIRMRADIEDELLQHKSHPKPLLSTYLDPETSLILVKANLKEKSLNFVIDTGANCNVFGIHLTSLLDGAIRDSNQHPKLMICDPQDLTVQGVSDALLRPAAVMDLSGISADTNTHVDGILGMPFLYGRVLALNFQHRRIDLYADSVNPVGIKLDLRTDEDHRPHVASAGLAGQSLGFLIDTGMNGEVSLNKERFTTLTRGGGLNVAGDVTTRTVWGREQGEWGVAHELTLGKQIRLPNIHVHRSEANKVGMQLLRKFNITIDFRQRLLFMEPRREWHQALRNHIALELH